MFLWTLDVVGRAVVSFVDQTYTTAWRVNEGLLFPDEGHGRSSMHWSWFQYVLLNCSCNSSFLMICFKSVIKTRYAKSIQTKEHLRKHAYTHIYICIIYTVYATHRKRTVTLQLSFLLTSCNALLGWKEECHYGGQHTSVNMKLFDGMFSKEYCRCLCYTPSISSTFQCVLPSWSGSGVCIACKKTSENNIFLCFVCCNLGDICFAMFSDLYARLKQWPSTLFLHATLTSKHVISLPRYSMPFLLLEMNVI